MKHQRILVTAGIIAAVLAAAGPASANQAAAPNRPAAVAQHARDPRGQAFDYYLALGDSLGAGYQPNKAGVGVITDKGYANDLAAQLKRENRHLGYVNLACPGETTGSMLAGGCPWPEPYTSQISAATAFLAAHRGAHVLVTIDIGANNIDSCATAAGIDGTCVAEGLGAIGAQLPQILGALKAASGPHTEFIGMNYYDPFLASWLSGAAGQAEAQASVTLGTDLDGLLAQAYGAFGIPVADVSGRFDTDDFTPLVHLAPGVKVPLNVARICAWTWMCAAAPVGPNIHANDAGYFEIAATFEELLERLR